VNFSRMDRGWLGLSLALALSVSLFACSGGAGGPTDAASDRRDAGATGTGGAAMGTGGARVGTGGATAGTGGATAGTGGTTASTGGATAGTGGTTTATGGTTAGTGGATAGTGGTTAGTGGTTAGTGGMTAGTGGATAGTGGTTPGTGGTTVPQVRSIVDRRWTNDPVCTGSVCRNLLLRADGSYVYSHIILDNLSYHCDRGTWSEVAPGKIALDRCEGEGWEAEWQSTSDGILFAGARYTPDLSSATDTIAFYPCPVNRLCQGLTCSEVLACQEECDRAIFPDPACPGNCVSMAPAKYRQQYDALIGCVAASGCSDAACIEAACAAQLAACE
jgi:hypothetical protein